jgi:hypothetical protein
MKSTPLAPVLLIAVGLAGFMASGAVGGGPSLAGALIAGTLNPVFFICVPWGLYLLSKHQSMEGERSEKPSFNRTPENAISKQTVATIYSHLFYYRAPDGTIFGPYTWQEIRDLAYQERIKADTPISQNINGPWKQASEFKR